MPYTIVYNASVVEKDIPAIPKTNRGQIQRAIEERIAIAPEKLGKPLRHNLKGYRRLRVGDWRIVYRIEGENVIVSAIALRRDVYEEK